MSQPTVAILGTGIMGSAMARTIAASGFTLRVWNRTRGRAHALRDIGATIADSPADAVTDADIVITMLADGDAVRTVMDGAIPSMRRDAVWAQMSTIAPEQTAAFRRRATDAGVRFVDAPVLGTKRPAEEGTLLVLASGTEDALETCDPVFDAVGARTIRLGPSGEGTKLKLVVNTWLLGMLGALAETIAFAERIGIDPHRFLDTIEGGATGTRYARVKGEAMIDRDYDPSFPLALARKDANLILAAAGGDLPTIAAVERLLAVADEAGLGDHDMAALIEGIR